ncbi:hypothetical protein BDW42DRAFT_167184 [Aspergillus taichungensis]|uniref:Uncharacterized protein n=1 Tax=Aspergillus taichungensis TaxID=482145 RepID=A0A2J5HXK6_9EURO|nr:hypothetical protein BDW42DRAFT_167184 [Aspergillus taichungensis]
MGFVVDGEVWSAPYVCMCCSSSLHSFASFLHFPFFFFQVDTRCQDERHQLVLPLSAPWVLPGGYGVAGWWLSWCDLIDSQILDGTGRHVPNSGHSIY